MRARVILASAEGKTAVEISLLFGPHPTNIKKWIRKFNADARKLEQYVREKKLSTN